MVTIFRHKNTTIKVISQQYETGLYVAWYTDEKIPYQIFRNEPEEKYHKKLRKEIEKNGGTFIKKGSTVL